MGGKARDRGHATAEELSALASELLAAFFDLRAAGQRIGAVARCRASTSRRSRTS